MFLPLLNIEAKEIPERVLVVGDPDRARRAAVMTIIEVPQSRSSNIPTLGSVILGWLVSFRSVFSGLGLV